MTDKERIKLWERNKNKLKKEDTMKKQNKNNKKEKAANPFPRWRQCMPYEQKGIPEGYRKEVKTNKETVEYKITTENKNGEWVMDSHQGQFASYEKLNKKTGALMEKRFHYLGKIHSFNNSPAHIFFDEGENIIEEKYKKRGEWLKLKNGDPNHLKYQNGDLAERSWKDTKTGECLGPNYEGVQKKAQPANSASANCDRLNREKDSSYCKDLLNRYAETGDNKAIRMIHALTGVLAEDEHGSVDGYQLSSLHH